MAAVSRVGEAAGTEDCRKIRIARGPRDKSTRHGPLKDLTPFLFDDLDDLYVKLSETLSAKTVREVLNVVHVALRRAVKTKLIPFNPADRCDLPRVDQKEAAALNADQLETYQRAATGTWVDLLVRLAAATGARRGELLAARWIDIDWNSGRIRIERSVYQIKGKIGLKPTKSRQAGVPIINVAKRLGHRDAYTTAKIYAHALPDTDQDVAATWDRVMSENREKNPVAQKGANYDPKLRANLDN
jgi:integrase